MSSKKLIFLKHFTILVCSFFNTWRCYCYHFWVCEAVFFTVFVVFIMFRLSPIIPQIHKNIHIKSAVTDICSKSSSAYLLNTLNIWAERKKIVKKKEQWAKVIIVWCIGSNYTTRGCVFWRNCECWDLLLLPLLVQLQFALIWDWTLQLLIVRLQC